MIPFEVALIAEVLAEHFEGSKEEYDLFIGLAYKIYDRLKLEQSEGITIF